MTRVRIRGIYATALTERLRDEVDVVGASSAIDRRFDDDFPVEAHAVSIDGTPDRQGVGAIGPPDDVAAVREHLDVAIDTLSWDDPAPRSAVFEARVTEELGSGAVVDLGPREGFLPYGAVDDHVTDGDELRVQVHEPAPPWGDRRPEVGARIRAFGGLCDLVRGGGDPRADVPDPGRAQELVRTVELLAADVPAGWTVHWRRGAADAGMDALGDALATAADRAREIDEILDRGEAHRDDLAEGTAWVWFGRESRFGLDGVRRTVTTTMPGHHRIKAGNEAASAAVDFAEGLCEPGGDFPFDLVARQFGPGEGDAVRIDHGKPEGERYALGEGEVLARDGRTITLRREMTAGGTYDALEVPRDAGDTATTKLEEGRWWYPTVYRTEDGESKGTYVNVCTPVELFPTAATYVDLHVDVVRHATGEVERVDDDELDEAEAVGHLSAPLAEKAREVATTVERALDSG